MRWIGQITYDEVSYFREDVIIEADNKLGIGTFSPSEKLHVVGDALITGDSLADAFKPAAAGEPIKFKNFGGTERARILDGGNVGIGTTSPASKLHVAGTVQVGADAAGHDVTFFGANSGRDMVWDTSSNALHIKDSAILKIGTGGDLQIKHNGSNNVFTNLNGHLEFINYGDNTDIKFTSDDGSGGTTEYLKLDGGYSSPQIIVPDNVAFNVGSGLDFNAIHNGSNTTLTNNTGNLTITNNTDDGDIIFQSDDGSGGVKTYMSLDGGWGVVNIPDSVELTLGTGRDLRLIHDGTDSKIYNYGGHLKIVNNTDDKDILFQCDDGSGGVATYFYLDGSLASSGYYYTRFPDQSILSIGDSNDLQIMHAGGNSLVRNFVGDLYFSQYADDKDIIFYCDDGSGGVTPYLTLDGGLGYMVAQKGVKHEGFLWLPDNKTLYIGSGNDLRIHHNGSDSYISQEGTGSLIIRNTTNDEDIIFQCDDGSGGTATYLTLDGSATKIVVNKDIYATDNVALRVGTSGDFRMLHTGTDSMMVNTNGDLYFNNQANDKDIIFKGMDNSSAITALTLDMSAAGQAVFNSSISIPDAGLALFGTGNDLQINHDGSNSYINHVGTGHMYIQNTTDDKDIILRSDDGSGSVTPYLTLDGGLGYMTAAKSLRFLDSTSAYFGASNDLTIQHDGSNSYINNGTGDLYIRQNTDNKDIIFQSDDGSGGVETYFFLDGSQKFIIVKDSIQF